MQDNCRNKTGKDNVKSKAADQKMGLPQGN